MEMKKFLVRIYENVGDANHFDLIINGRNVADVLSGIVKNGYDFWNDEERLFDRKIPAEVEIYEYIDRIRLGEKLG